MKNHRYSLLIAGLACLSACDRQTGVSADSYPAAETRAAQSYVQYCGGCHKAPLPARYTFAAWSPVLERMQQLRQSRGMAPIPATELALILDYLQQHAAQ